MVADRKYSRFEGRVMTYRGLFLALFVIAGAGSADAGQQVLYRFCQKNCREGDQPYANVIRDASGNLFGTTSVGGKGDDQGSVFELKPKVHGGWKFLRLHLFCPKRECRDGAGPQGNLIVDTGGNLYGTTVSGGKASGVGGTVFELSPAGGAWTLKTLHSFSDPAESAPINLTYAGAASGLPYDGTSTLYGVTSNGTGAIFSLTPKGRSWREKRIYTFCALASCADGTIANAGLFADETGNLFGTTLQGGAANQGVLFELSPHRAAWSQTVLHSFCSQANCTDGRNPSGGVVRDAQGNLIGAAPAGGAFNGGVLYKVMPNGASSQYTVIHDFCALANCTDGADPYPAPVMDAVGNLFGSTIIGGTHNIQAGTLFELSAGGQFDVLYSFCGAADCSDGSSPAFYSPLALDGSGDIFGTTQDGGVEDAGTVFEYTP
jgi:uncharacterized repeat protein (TIGR03803 family)